MSQFASQPKRHFSSGSSLTPKEERPRQNLAREPRKEKRAGPRDNSDHLSASPMNEIPFGAIHVDASGIVLEHRPAEAGDSARAHPIVGRQVSSIAPWAGEPAFASGLESAIDSTKVSFHFDFKTSANSLERAVHVNILAAGDKTVWIFVSDKTLPMFS